MKRHYFLMFLSLLFGSAAIAQAVYPSSSYAVAGDSFYISNAQLDSLSQFNFQTAGADVNWNYGTLQIKSQYVDRYPAPAATGYENSFIAECVATGETRAKCEAAWAALTNIAHKQQDSLVLSTIELTDITNLQEKTTGSLVTNIEGATLQSNGPNVAISIKYTRPDTVYHFPLEYGHEDSCNSYYILNLKNLGINLQYHAHTKRVNDVEGWGNVTTPYLNYPTVIKLKTTLTYSDTIIYNGKVIPVVVPKGIQYRWFDPNVARAVLLVSGYFTGGGQQVYNDIEFIDTPICLNPVAKFTIRPDLSKLNLTTDKDTVDFVNNSLNANSYTWNFGDPGSGKKNTSTAGSTYHVYTSVGDYTVTLIACNTICVPTVCDTLTKTATVVDSAVVVANFSYNPLEPCQGTSIAFTNHSINATSYLWIFGDGSSAVNTTDAQHIYAAAGTYKVTLYAIGSTSTDSIIRTVVVSATPVASISASGPLTFCEGGSVTLTASAGDVYLWSTGSDKPFITVKKAGVYGVTVSNACGTSHTSATVNVNPVFVPSVTITPSANGICPGTIVVFTATPTNGGSNPVYQWKVNGTVEGTNAASYTDANVSNGDVVSLVMTSSLATCVIPDSATDTVKMIVANSIVPSVSIASTPQGPSYCQGTNVVFYAIPIGGGNAPVIQWKLNNGLVSSTDSFTSNTLTNGDVLSVTLTSNSQCASPTTADTSLTLTILPVPVTRYNTSICLGDTLDGYTTSGTYIDTFAAANGCDSIRTLLLTIIQPVLTNINQTICNTQSYEGYTSSGTYIDTFLSAAGCDSIRTLNLTVNPNDTATVTITPSANGVCTGTPVSFTATATFGGNAPSYAWTLNGASIGANSPYLAATPYNNNDVVAVTLTSNQTCAIPNIAYDTVIMIVNSSVVPGVSITSNPSAPYCQGNPVTFYANVLGGGNSPTLTWKLNGTTVSSTDSFTSSTLNNGDALVLNLVSDAACASPTTASTTDDVVVDSVAVTIVDTAICPGSSYYNYNTAGTYIDTFAAADACDSIRTLNLTVLPVIADTIDTTICEGDSVDGYQLAGTYIDVFTAASGCDSTRTLVLTVNPVGISSIAYTICQSQLPYLGIYDSAGSYINTIPNGSADGCDSFVYVILTVNPNPGIPTINISNDTAYATDTSADITYQWYNSTSLITGATNNYYVFSTAGNFSVIVTSTIDGCSNLNKGSILGISKSNPLGGISIYPNPTPGKFMVSLPQMQGQTYQVQVWNMVGQQVVPVITASDPSLQIDLSSFSQGLYLIQVEQGNQLWTGRISKE